MVKGQNEVHTLLPAAAGTIDSSPMIEASEGHWRITNSWRDRERWSRNYLVASSEWEATSRGWQCHYVRLASRTNREVGFFFAVLISRRSRARVIAT